MKLVEWIAGHRERIGALLHHGGECAIELVRTAHPHEDHLHAQRRRRGAQFFAVGDMRGIIWIPEKSHPRDGWDDLFDELCPFGANVWTQDGIAGDIAAGAREAR